MPARNEEQRLPALIKALGAQTWLAAEGRTLKVVVVLNNCTDGSRRAALTAAKQQPNLQLDLVEIWLPPERAHVGSARRLAMERALGDQADRSRALVLTTDADAVPAPDWIDANIAAINEGADIVGGHIFGDSREEQQLGPGFSRRAAMLLHYAALTDRLAALIDPLSHDPWPRHRDHTGASLAVRGAVYHAVGGLPPLPFREDLAFVKRVRAAGGRLRHPLGVKVEVSARLVGRAPGGMADCLKDWMRAEAEGRPLLVEAPGAVERRLLRRSALRKLCGFSGAERERVALSLGLDPRLLVDEQGTPLLPAALVELYAPDEPDALACTPVDVAAAHIQEMIATQEGASFAA